MCDVRVSVFGQPDSLRTVRERLFTLRGVQVVIISILNSALKVYYYSWSLHHLSSLHRVLLL